MPRRIKHQHIVIVEDDPSTNAALRTYFELQNKVDCFLSAELALQAQTHFGQVDVFIIDYKLPGQDGIELFHQLRPSFFNSKFILITGEMNYELAENTRQVGLDALILKPFDFTILEDNICALLSIAA